MDSQSIAGVIDHQEWLNGIDSLQKLVRDLLDRSGPVKNALHGLWLGHPLHPVLTDVPLGAWTVAMVLDAAELLGGTGAAKGADAAVAIGLAGAVGSAITGIADWSATDGRVKRIGTVHAGLNIAATLLYTGSLLLRGRKRSRPRALGLSMLGFAATSAAAYLGGHLVYGEQVGVDHTATSTVGQPDHWVAAAQESDLQDHVPFAGKVGAAGVVCMVRRGERVDTLGEICPHLGGPLSEGKLGRGTIRCPWHGSEFRLRDGAVVNGPSVYPARSFESRIRDGKVEVRSVDPPPVP